MHDPADTQSELPVTWNRAARVWWRVLWRLALANYAIGLPLGFLLGMAGAPRSTALAVNGVVQVIVAILGIAIVKRVLTTSFSEFRIILRSPSR